MWQPAFFLLWTLHAQSDKSQQTLYFRKENHAQFERDPLDLPELL